MFYHRLSPSMLLDALLLAWGAGEETLHPQWAVHGLPTSRIL